MTTTPNAGTAESMGKVLALTRALHSNDRTAGEMFMPGTYADTVRLLVGAYTCLGLLLSDARLSGILKEAARLAQQATVPAARQVVTCTLAFLAENKVMVPSNHADSVTALAAACGLIQVIAEDQRLDGLHAELQALNGWAMVMMQQNEGKA